MHDPLTSAHEIKYPWYQYAPWPKKYQRDPHPWEKKRSWEKMPDGLKATRHELWPEGYRESFITIWHCDPERDGSDDSCGYSYIKLTPQQREILRNAAWAEGYKPHFLICREKEWTGSHQQAESLYRGLVLLVCRVLDIKMSWSEVCRYACEAIHVRDGGSKYGGVFCFLPGYHTNSQKDSEDNRQDHFHGILCNVARVLLTEKRPWYRHPKWHFWHWKIQVHPLQAFKRWAFSRCCKCEKGFKWGEGCVTHSWYGTGPLWFRSERNTMHDRCSGAMGPSEEKPAQSVTKSNPGGGE